MRTLVALLLAGCSAASAPVASPATSPVVSGSSPSPMDSPPVTAPPPAPGGLRYPAARRGDVVDQLHGVAVPDPYRWMEDMGSAQTRAWVDQENALTDAQLTALPGREVLRTRIASLGGYETFSKPTLRGGRYFWFHNDGKQSRAVLYTAKTLDGAPTALLDPNTIGADGSLAFAGLVINHDGTRIAYGLAAGGGDWQTWRLRDVATGKDLPDELPNIKYYAPKFTRDGAGLYYSRFPAPPAGKELTETDHDCRVYYHRVGTDAAKDPVVYERPDHPTWQFELDLTEDGRYLVIATGDGQVGDRGQELISYLDLGRAVPGKTAPTPLIDQYEAEYVFVGSDGPSLYFMTTADAARKRVIAIDVRTPARARWKQIVPEGPNAILSATTAGRQLFVTTLADAYHAVAVYDRTGKKVRDVALPGIGSAGGFGADADARELYYQFSGFTAPGSIYRYELATGKSTLWKAPKVPFDAAQLETTQVFFPSKDGTKVPMFLVAKKGLPRDGKNPVIMSAYGFGGISTTPRFVGTQIAWLERGGVLAVVNVRGGGEYGEAWHTVAMRTKRQVTYDDFLAAGDYLVAEKITSPAHLGATGGSGGGLLVATAALQRPELFGAVAPLAGVHDLLRFHKFGQGAGWQGELGSPDNPEEFAVLRATSPLHIVRPGTRYPAMYIVTADHDVRVAPLHSYKLAAALQAAQAGPAPILLRVETKSGHSGGSTRAQAIDQATERLLFFAAHLGLKIE